VTKPSGAVSRFRDVSPKPGFGFEPRIDRRSIERVSVLHTFAGGRNRVNLETCALRRFPTYCDLPNRNAPLDALLRRGATLRAHGVRKHPDKPFQLAIDEYDASVDR
jgi:hypothetical protein